MQKLRERPTPKFYRRGASCDRVSRKILIAGTELGRLGSSRWEEALELPLAFLQKKMAAVWAGQSKKILISVYQRTCYSANLSDNPPKNKRSYSTPISE
jgi:hypothetical protein